MTLFHKLILFGRNHESWQSFLLSIIHILFARILRAVNIALALEISWCLERILPANLILQEFEKLLFRALRVILETDSLSAFQVFSKSYAFVLLLRKPLTWM